MPLDEGQEALLTTLADKPLEGGSIGKRCKLGAVSLVLAMTAVGLVAVGVQPFSSLNARFLNSPAGPADAEDYVVCGEVAEGVEYHTQLSLRRVPNIFSELMCCAACSADPNCKVWTWGEKRLISGLSNSCYLKHLLPDERPTTIARPGVVSGILLHRLDKHGIVTKELAGVQPSITTWTVKRQETCRGGIDFAGYGQVQVVNAQRFTPGFKSTTVEVDSGSWELMPHLRSRAFFGADTCTAGEYNSNQFANLQLLGRTMHYTVDLSGAGCGCNAQLMLVPMRRKYRKMSRCGDYFCGPAQKNVCGETCHAIRLQDANQHAWSTSVQLENDEHGVAVGYGGGFKQNGRRDWNQMQYGIGGACIDTSLPFQVDVSFQSKKGMLEALRLALWQPGQSCNLTARIDEYSFRGKNGLEELGKMLEEGATPVISYWSSPHMQWLDGLGKDGVGPCVEDNPLSCPRTVRFYDFAMRWHATQRPHPSDVALDDALMALNKEVEQNTERKTKAEMKATLPCTGSCAENLHPDFIESNRAEMKEQVENTEWEVVFDILPVRKTPHFDGLVIRHKRKGQVIVGEVTGNWIRLLREPGWVAIKKVQKRTVVFLVPRSVKYTKLKSGTCESAGMFPIDGKENCQAASFALGYLDTFVNSFDNATSNPFGCYLVKGQLFFVSDPANKHHDVGRREMICSSQAYPTTTVTTTNNKAAL